MELPLRHRETLQAAIAPYVLTKYRTHVTSFDSNDRLRKGTSCTTGRHAQVAHGGYSRDWFDKSYSSSCSELATGARPNAPAQDFRSS